MLKTGYKKFIIALLLLAFTSQTMATAAMACQLNKATQAVAVAMDITEPAMAHTHHHMSEMPAHEMAAMDHSMHPNIDQKTDCCKTMGQCLLGSCSLAAVSTETIFLLIKLDSKALDFYLCVVPPTFISSLYRPPIFC